MGVPWTLPHGLTRGMNKRTALKKWLLAAFIFLRDRKMLALPRLQAIENIFIFKRSQNNIFGGVKPNRKGILSHSYD